MKKEAIKKETVNNLQDRDRFGRVLAPFFKEVFTLVWETENGKSWGGVYDVPFVGREETLFLYNFMPKMNYKRLPKTDGFIAEIIKPNGLVSDTRFFRSSKRAARFIFESMSGFGFKKTAELPENLAKPIPPQKSEDEIKVWRRLYKPHQRAIHFSLKALGRARKMHRDQTKENPASDYAMCVSCGVQYGRGSHVEYTQEHPQKPLTSICAQCGDSSVMNVDSIVFAYGK